MPYQDISERYRTRVEAERYRDRFRKGRRSRTHEREAAALRSALGGLGALDTALDVGSGPGRFVPAFMDHVSRLIQADYSPNMLHVSRDDHPLPPSQGAHVQADARRLPFASGSCDVVFSHRLLNHLTDASDRNLALAEAARVSRRYVIVSCLCPPSWLRTLHRMWRRLKGRASVRVDVDVNDVLDAARRAGLVPFARTPIRSLLQSAAFFTLAKGQEEPEGKPKQPS